MRRLLRVVASCFVCAFAFGADVKAQGAPPQDPILRIDPGMHTAPIKRITVDAACTLLATGSHDKTVRLWRLPDGKLITTFRPPIGPGDVGKVYAVAMAPDASWVAAGGWTLPGQNFVYVFQTATGIVMTRLGPLPNVVHHLAVSRDGRFLAATLGGRRGLRVWERTGASLDSWRLVAEDADYGGSSYGAAFAPDGALYTVAWDGKLRRYAPGYKAKPTAVATKGGRRPFSVAVAVHPAGHRVAVGFEDSTAVEVYDATTLKLRFAADTKGVDNGELSTVSWSADGAKLYAGGRFNRGGLNPIRVWDRAGEDSPRELDGSVTTIMHLLPCGDGIAVGASDPAFGLIAADGTRRLWQERVQADMREKLREYFTVSADGRRVRFGLTYGSDEPVLFDLATESLRDAPDPIQDLHAADTQSLPVTDWEDDYHPKLAGAPIKLEANETARSLAITPDKERFVLGTEYQLRAYDRDGKPLWERDVLSEVWGVNLAQEGKLVIAAYGDGTIRWHRSSDGEELLALFVHAKDEERRWVAWTPKGYYLASPGAESLIGWHVNRSWNEAADWFSVGQFREQFNRPDIVQLVLSSLDEEKAIKEANARSGLKRANENIREVAPPTVVILQPRDNALFRDPDVRIRYRAISPSPGPIYVVPLLQPAGSAFASRAAPVPYVPKGQTAELPVRLPEIDTTVTLHAYQEGRVGKSESIRLRWDGAKAGEEPPA
jgi:WD40 repeat protein